MDILAGTNGDAPAEPRIAGRLGRRLVELNVSAIIDLYELPQQERKRFIKLFLENDTMDGLQEVKQMVTRGFVWPTLFLERLLTQHYG